jgi:hypothetical protein
MLAGGLGIAWLVGSGAWPFFWQIVTGPDREYLGVSRLFDPGERIVQFLTQFFFPWGLLSAAGVALAVLNIGAILRSARSAPGARTLLARPLLFSAFFLGWWFESSFLQMPHDYVVAPTVLLAVTAVLGLWPPIRPRFIGWGLVLAFAIVAVSRHPLVNRQRLALWSLCWTEGSSAELRNRLQLTRMTHTPDWVRLGQVAEFLRQQDLHDGELTCFCPSATDLYLELDLKPSTPAVHFELFYTHFLNHAEEIRQQLNASPQRYVVTDLRFPAVFLGKTWDEPADPPPELPPNFPEDWHQRFPWSEPIVFRSGFYLVHRVTGPVNKLR